MPSSWFDLVGLFRGQAGDQAQQDQQQGAQEAAAQQSLGQMGVYQGYRPQYNYVIQNPYEWVNIVEARQEPIEPRLGMRMPAPQPHQYNSHEAIHNLANSFMMEGIEFSTIVVPRATFHRLYITLNAGRMQMWNDPPASMLQELAIPTAMGMVKIICEDDKPKGFDLSKYMETVE